MVAIIAAIGSFFLVRSAIVYASNGAGTALSSEAWQGEPRFGSQPTAECPHDHCRDGTPSERTHNTPPEMEERRYPGEQRLSAMTLSWRS
jgi:hypothetical protein